ncbi:hypothetical protein KFL_001420130 [Klebsormidium nitens]|uniref:Uncharacterized protein n=1 Tax=Klebsormidium nitens TaxID=105231 RepID=A0A1Y1I588_KLENI|nr:hypothetical protein KFL_001420130 [Klebsormidium nitens]|eukprot:GAQ83288.1 hypothetical protein KFL_001420130 [Klebsormidium nitens]
MDDVTSIAVEQIALEGPEGCSIPTLWTILQEPLQTAGFSLDPPLCAFIWNYLLDTSEIHLFSPHPLDKSTLSSTGEAPRRPPHVSKPATGEAAPPVTGQKVPARYFLEKAQPSLQIWEEAAALGGGSVRVQASLRLRESALGLYERVLSGYELSAVQYESLVRIGQSRERGALQTDLARSFGIAPTNYFYHLRQLETRGLITRRQVLFHAAAGSFPAPTNLVHLMRFGRSVNIDHRTHFRTGPSDTKRGQKQLTYPGEASAPGRPSESGAGPSEPREGPSEHLNQAAGASKAGAGASEDGPGPSEHEFEFVDLTRQLEDICGVLGAARGGVLVEPELRASMGYTNKREWRALVRRLEAEGLVRQFQAEVNGRAKACLQLKRGFHEAAEPQPEDEMEEEEGPEGVVLDVPVDQQIYECVRDAGREGIRSNHLWKRLHLNRKNNTQWSTTLIESGSIVQHAETLKKAVLYRLWTAGNFPGAPEKQTQEPPEAEKSVRGGRETRAETPPEAETRGMDDEKMEGAEVGRTEEQTRGEQEEGTRGGQGESSAKGPVSEGARDTALVVYQGAEQEGLGQGPHVSRFRRTSKMVTSDARVRQELIMKKLEKDKFIIRSTLSRWLALEMGRDKPLDFKLVTRTLTDLQTEGLVKGVLITVPDAGDPSKSRPVEVVIPGDFEPDQEFADFIGKTARGVERISRQTGFQTKKAVTAPATVTVERLENYKALHQRKREAAEKNLDMQNAMKHNGYLYSKALRARALHLYLWQHVFGSPVTAAMDPAANKTEAVADGRAVGLETGTEPISDGEANEPAVEGEAGTPAEDRETASEVPGTEQRQSQGAADVTKRARDFDRPVGRICRPDVYETLQSIRESLARAALGGNVSIGGAVFGGDAPALEFAAGATGPRQGQPAPADVADVDADVGMFPDLLGQGGDALGAAAGPEIGGDSRARVAEGGVSELDDVSGSGERPGGRAGKSSKPGPSNVVPPSSSGVWAGKVRGMRPSVKDPRAAFGEGLGAAQEVVERVKKLVEGAKAEQESALEKYLRFKVVAGGASGAAALRAASAGEALLKGAVAAAVERVQRDENSNPMVAGDNGNRGDQWINILEIMRDMPVELYIKIVGSALPLERVNELTQNGARVRDCTPDELRTEILGPQAMTRLANTVDMMRRMDLVTPKTLETSEVGNGGPSLGLKKLGALYKLNDTIYFEEPADGGPVVHSFNTSDESDVLSYWDRLEACFSGLRKEDARAAFPGVVASEIVGRVWATRHELTPGQRIELGRRIPAEKELSAEEVEKIAKDTGIATEQVYKVYYERTRRTRLSKLLSLGLSQTEVLTALRKKKALNDSKKSSQEPPKQAPEPESAEVQRARARKTLTTERSHVRAFKRKQALADAEPPPPLLGKRGIPGPHAKDSPYLAWARENVEHVDVSRASPADVTALVADDTRTGFADVTLGRAGVTDGRADGARRGAGKRSPAKRSRFAAPTREERLDADGRLVVPSRVRRKRSRAKAAVRAEGFESEGEELGGFAGPPLRDGRMRKKPFAKRRKRFHWTAEDTKQLIAAYAIWHSIHGKRMPTEWDAVPGLPAPVPCCKRQMTKLRNDKATLEAIAYVVVLVADRRAAALAAEPPQEGGAQSEEKAVNTPPEEEQPSESEHIVRELSLMLENEKQRDRGFSKEPKVKGKRSTAEHRAMDRVLLPPSNLGPGGGAEFAWDDVTEPELARALDEVARCFEAVKAAQMSSGGVPPPVEAAPHGPGTEEGPARGIARQPVGDVIAVEETERLEDRPGVASALGLIEIGLLHARPNGAISETVARALKRCGEGDVACAMQHLQARKFVVQSKPTRPFRMAEKFNQHLASSPFPLGIGKSARDFQSALKAESAGKWISLPSLPSEGQLAQTLAMVVEGKAEIEPFEPGFAPWGSESLENGPPRERGPPEWKLGIRIRGSDGVEALTKGSEGLEGGLPAGLDHGLAGVQEKGGASDAQASYSAGKAVEAPQKQKGPSEEALAESSEQAAGSGPRTRRRGRRDGKAPEAAEVSRPAESRERKEGADQGGAPEMQEGGPGTLESGLEKSTDAKGKRRMEEDEHGGSRGKRPRVERPSTETGLSAATTLFAGTETGPSATHEPEAIPGPLPAVDTGPRFEEATLGAVAPQTDNPVPAPETGPAEGNGGLDAAGGGADVSVPAADVSNLLKIPQSYAGPHAGAEVEAAFELCCGLWCSDDVTVTSGRPCLDRRALWWVFEAARAAGDEGLTFDDVSEILAGQEGAGVLPREVSGQQSGGNGHRAGAADYVEALEMFDLVQRINSVDSVRIMSAPFSERHLLPVPSDGVNQQLPRGGSGDPLQVAEPTPGPSGGKGPPQGVGIQPWLTPRGGMNRAFCALLRRRIVSLVMANPGIPEELLLPQVEVLTPQSGRDFLDSLVSDGHLSVRAIRSTVATARPSFDVPRGPSERVTKGRVVKHYFASPAVIALV